MGQVSFGLEECPRSENLETDGQGVRSMTASGDTGSSMLETSIQVRQRRWSEGDKERSSGFRRCRWSWRGSVNLAWMYYPRRRKEYFHRLHPRNRSNGTPRRPSKGSEHMPLLKNFTDDVRYLTRPSFLTRCSKITRNYGQVVQSGCGDFKSPFRSKRYLQYNLWAYGTLDTACPAKTM